MRQTKRQQGVREKMGERNKEECNTDRVIRNEREDATEKTKTNNIIKDHSKERNYEQKGEQKKKQSLTTSPRTRSVSSAEKRKRSATKKR